MSDQIQPPDLLPAVLPQVDPAQFGLTAESSDAKRVAEAFKPMLEQMVSLETEYNALVGLPIDEDLCEKARELRLKYVRVRTATAKAHKALKEGVLKFGRFLDGWKNAQEQASGQIEGRLEAVERFYVEQEIARRRAIHDARAAELTALEYPSIPANLDTLDDLMWSHLKAGAEAALASRRKAEAEAAEAKRLAEEAEKARLAAEAAERERIRKENERLKAEAEERERNAAAERQAAAKREAALKAEQERQRKAAEEKLRRERESAEEAKREVEKEAQKARAAIEAKAAEERRAAEEARRELERMAREHEAKERAAREKAEKEEAERLRRQLNEQHRAQVHATIINAINGMNYSQIVEAIAAGKVPYVSIEY